MTADRRVQRVQTGSPWEQTIGFARAVAAGDRVLVAGTLPLVDGVLHGEGSPYEQAGAAFGNALAALEPFGLDRTAVIRTRMYLSHARDVDEVARAHKDLFDTVRPAATLVVVSGLVDSRALVEVELEAFRDRAAGPGTGAEPGGRTEPGTAAAPDGDAGPGGLR